MLTEKLYSQIDYTAQSIGSTSFSKGYTKQYQLAIPAEFADGTFSLRIIVKSGNPDTFIAGSTDLINSSVTITSTSQVVTITSGQTANVPVGQHTLDIVITKSTTYIEYGRYTLFCTKPVYDSGAPIVSVTPTVSTINTNTTINNTFNIIKLSGVITITLPTAVGNSGKIFTFKSISSGTKTISAAGGEFIDEFSTRTLTTIYSSLQIFSDGIQWLIIN